MGLSLVEKTECRIATYFTGREAVLVLLPVQILEGHGLSGDGRCRAQTHETGLRRLAMRAPIHTNHV
jgi:hypothetical protein